MKRKKMYKIPIPELKGDDRARFWRRMTKPNLKDCWLWKRSGLEVSSGYGRFWIGNANFRAHRIAFKLYYGYDPDVCMHLPTCKRHCCNPLHLKNGSNWKNTNDTPPKYIYKRGVIVGERSTKGAKDA